MPPFNKEAGAALVFGILYLGLWVWMESGFISGRYKLRSRWTLLLFHITVRVASQVSGHEHHSHTRSSSTDTRYRSSTAFFSSMIPTDGEKADRLAVFLPRVLLAALTPENGSRSLTIVLIFVFSAGTRSGFWDDRIREHK